jgi:hypothetical protein
LKIWGQRVPVPSLLGLPFGGGSYCWGFAKLEVGATIQTLGVDGVGPSPVLRSFVKLLFELRTTPAAFAVPTVFTCKQAARVAVVVS